MDLSVDLIKEFAKITNDEQVINEGATVYGRYVLQGDKAFVEIDGSDGVLTPVATTSTAKNNDRVTVLIKDHTAIVTGNLTDPSASSDEVEELRSNLDLGLGGLNDAIKKTQDDLTDLSEDFTIMYTDIDGNIQTIETELGKVSSQVTGMAASIEGAAKVATNYISFEEGYGLVIGNLTGTTLGFNTLLDATSLNIRYNDIVLAKYAADTIYLGYNSENSEIDLLNGLGEIKASKSPDESFNILTFESENIGITTYAADDQEHKYPIEINLYQSPILSEGFIELSTPSSNLYVSDSGVIELRAGRINMSCLNDQIIATSIDLNTEFIDFTGRLRVDTLQDNAAVDGYSTYQLLAAGNTGIVYKTKVSLKDLVDGSMKVTAVFG